jgi:hypothetical protein
MRLRIAFAVGLALSLAAAATAVAATPKLSALVLKPSQVGNGYLLLQRSDGRGTAQRTLDLCGTTGYASETRRTGRLQVNFLKPNALFAVSNEIVTYSAGGAAQALREVARHADDCPRGPIAFEGQPPLTYRITRIVDAKLLKGYVAVRIHVTGTVKGKRVDTTAYAVYQRLGNVLSGVYTYGAATAAQERLCLHAAEASANDLRGGGAPGGIPA